MADYTPVSRWLADRRQKFDLKVTELRWGKSLSRPIFDFQVKIKWQNQIITGRGTALNENLALEKACAEAIERTVCANYKISTEGVALHPVQFEARENAKFEALERALFAWHKEKLIPFLSVHNEWTREYENILKTFEPEAKVDYRLMNTPEGSFAPICKLTLGANLFLGLSCGTEYKETFDKAFYEALRNLAAYEANPGQYTKAIEKNPDLWCGDARFIKKLNPLFEKTVNKEKFPVYKVITESLNVQEVPHLSDCRFFVEKVNLQMEPV